jgi:two-component system LytT family response regulator
MIRTMIVDDELHCREYLSGLVTKYCPELEITGTAGSVSEALEHFARNKPELVFLDIQMPGENGFDFLDQGMIRKCRPAIIFTTAYDQYAIKAFRYSAIDYLLKPVNIQQLSDAVKKVSNHLSQTNYSVAAEIFKQLNLQTPASKLCLPVNDGFKLTEISFILYFEAQGSYSNVFFTDQKPLLVCKPVAYFEEILDSNRFFRTHRSYLVNTDHIISFNSDEDYLVLSDKSIIRVSKRKKAQLLQYIRGFVQF